MSWDKVKLGDVIEKPISGEWGEEGDGVFVLRTTNFSNDGSLDLKNVIKRIIDADKVAKKKLRIGDTIIEKSGGSPAQPVGRVVYYNIETINGDTYLCNNFTSVLRPTKKVNPKYLFWFLFNNHVAKQTLRYQNKTTGIINLQTERYLNELQIPLPPLPIQQKIAAILDQADALRKKDKQLLAKYDELLQAVFYEMFGDLSINEKKWDETTIDNVCEEIVDCVNKTAPTVDYQTEYLMIRTTNVKEGEINLNEIRYVTKDVFDKWTRRLLPRMGDIIFTREAPAGEAAILNIDKKFFLGQRTMQFRCNKNVTNEYFLLSQLLGKDIQNQISKLGTGSTVKHLSVPACNKFLIKVPPIELQNHFGQIAQNIQKQKQQLKQQMDQSENLFQSLLQRAFKGELVKE